MLFTIILLVIAVVCKGIILYYELTTMKDRIEYLETRVLKLDLNLNKLERDAVKVTFSESPQDEKVIIHPKVKNKPNNPYHRKPGTEITPKVMGEWQTKNKNKPLIEGRAKSQIKEDTGPTQGPPPPLPAKKPKNYNK